MIVPVLVLRIRGQNARTGEGTMLGVLMAVFPGGPSNMPEDLVLAAATPSPTPSVVSSDYASALPSWLLVSLLVVVGLVIAAAFILTAYSLSAPRSTLKNMIGRKANTGAPDGTITPQLMKTLATAARSGRRTTRTTLAIVGFSLLGVVIIAVFGLSGQGVRDLRNQVIAAVTTLIATIAGFYFGAETARNQGIQGGPTNSAPTLKPDPNSPAFAVGQSGSYTPVLTGTPAPTVSVGPGALPTGLQLNPATGVISGTPAQGTDQTYDITLTAHNGIAPDATLPVKLVILPFSSAPSLRPDPNSPAFAVGQSGSYTPVLTGTPAPTVSVSPGALPTGLQLNPATGVISGTPAQGTDQTYQITLTAHNGIGQDAVLPVQIVINPAVKL
jgi:Putative Ig domain